MVLDIKHYFNTTRQHKNNEPTQLNEKGIGEYSGVYKYVMGHGVHFHSLLSQ